MFVVAGVSGHTGSVVAETLLSQRKPVRVVVRDAARGEAWKARGAEVAVASLTDAEAFGRAIEGAEGVYVLLPPFGFADEDPSRERPAQIAGITGALRKGRPAHVVVLSSIGAQHPAGTGPIAALHALEREVAATGVPATFLRAAYFMENWGASLAGAIEGGALYNALIADKKISQVATRDIGTTAARLLVEPVRSGTRVVELSGPVDYSLDDTAAALSAVVGKPIAAVQVPIEGLKGALKGMGASAAVADLYGEMTDAINRDHVSFEGGAALRVRGATTLETVLRSLLGR
ncbi:MAG: hypothetical protein EPO40_33230 [Myxococcaceae bacterium]|nr:MAG: hypothetical protein EPO40_33230 [Myxococcaceae bacterium]